MRSSDPEDVHLDDGTFTIVWIAADDAQAATSLRHAFSFLLVFDNSPESVHPLKEGDHTP